jgi:glycosyltransferase involved in cell wall biosynthesis
MSQSLVSVVVIFLNGERFIEEAVDSVFAQTYRHWELILVDDGSTDRSSSIARRYAASFPERVRYVQHPGHVNLGMSASRNLGVHESSGEYVALLDADDVWLPDKLAAQVSMLDAQPAAAMVYGPAEWWYSWTGKPQDQTRDFVHELGMPPDRLIPPPLLLIRLLEDEGISPCTCSILIRREVFDQVGGFEEQFRGLYEDQAFCAKVCLDSTVMASGRCSFRYRQHPSSALYVADRHGSRLAARASFLDWLSAYLAASGVSHPELWRTLNRERSRLTNQPGTRIRGGMRVVERALRSAALRVSGGRHGDK